MATIRTAIQIYDGMSRPLQSMHRAMGILLNSFESMQSASSNAIDTAAIREAREELARAGAAFDEIERNIRETEQAQDRFNNRIRDGTSAADGLWSKLKGIAATVGLMAGTKKILDLSDTLSSTTARLNLLVDDGGSLEELEQKVMASAQRSRAAYFDTASAVAKLGLNAGSAFGNDMDQVIAFMEQVNKQFVMGGATAQQQSDAMTQLTQAMAAGALRGEELNSILDAATGIARTIESYMGVAEGSIKQYAEQGLVTAEVVKNALFSVADETNAKFESMPMTWAQIWTSMQNKALSIFAPILRKINEIGNGHRFTKVTDGVIDSLAAIASVATVVFDLLVGGVSFVVDHWSWLAPIVSGVAVALFFLHGAMLAYNTVAGITNALETVRKARLAMTTVATGAQTTATFAQTAAQYGLNAALLACPITVIILSIIALIAVFYAAIAAVNHFAGTSLSATGIICGAVLVLAALVGNTAIGLFNGLIQMLWNMFAYPALGILEWVLNVANGGFDSFGGAVANLIGNIIGWFLSLGQVVTTIIDAIFGTNWTDGLEALKSNVIGWGKNENAITIDREAPKIDYRFQYSDAFETGDHFGRSIEENITGLFDFSVADTMGAGDPLAAYDIGNTLDGIYNNTSEVAGNTASARDTLELAEENLEYMRDIAEREAINRYTTAQIKVEQHNENHISSDMDLDGIMNVWTNDFAEKLDISGEGVHE